MGLQHHVACAAAEYSSLRAHTPPYDVTRDVEDSRDVLGFPPLRPAGPALYRAGISSSSSSSSLPSFRVGEELGISDRAVPPAWESFERGTASEGALHVLPVALARLLFLLGAMAAELDLCDESSSTRYLEACKVKWTLIEPQIITKIEECF